MDDAVAQWAKKIASHLAADEIARVTWQVEAPDPTAAAYLNRAKPLLARALQRRLREAKPVEITARISQNLKNYLFIAEMHGENDPFVEIVSMPRPLNVPAPPTGFRLDRHLLWEQELPILDAFAIGAEMLVLDTSGVTRYEQQESKWRKAEAAALEIPPVRDPRGRLTVVDNAVTAEFSGVMCRGAWKPALSIECQPGGRFTAERNTMSETGRPDFFNSGDIAGDRIVTESDGRTYIYDEARKTLNAWSSWGDFAVVSTQCGGAKAIASDAATDSLAAFDVVNHNPIRVSDAAEVPGAVTALWPTANAAVAVVRNKSTSRYEAYSIAVDCGR